MDREHASSLGVAARAFGCSAQARVLPPPFCWTRPESSKQGLGQRGSECRPLSNEPESDGSSVVGRTSLTESLPFVDHPRVLLLSFPRSPPPSFLRDVGCASQRCPFSFSWGYRPRCNRTIALPPGAGRGPGHRLCLGRLSTHTGAVGPRGKQAHPGARGHPSAKPGVNPCVGHCVRKMLLQQPLEWGSPAQAFRLQMG